jgi:hypothetical protein
VARLPLAPSFPDARLQLLKTAMSIGPALPPHLLAQATPNLHSDDSDGDDVAGPSLPPASLGPSLPPGLAGTSSASTRVNENEDGGTGDAYASSISAGYANGSRAPVGPHRPSAASIGPMPPAVAAGRAPSAPAPADEDDEDDYVPALPPGFARPGPSASTASAAVPRAAPSARRPVAGPTMPGRGAPAPALDDDSDDDVGPRPLPVGLTTTKKDAAAEFREREEARRKAVEVRLLRSHFCIPTLTMDPQESLAPKKLVRDEWMLKPPSASELLNSAHLLPCAIICLPTPRCRRYRSDQDYPRRAEIQRVRARRPGAGQGRDRVQPLDRDARRARAAARGRGLRQAPAHGERGPGRRHGRGGAGRAREAPARRGRGARRRRGAHGEPFRFVAAPRVAEGAAFSRKASAAGPWSTSTRRPWPQGRPTTTRSLSSGSTRATWRSVGA